MIQIIVLLETKNKDVLRQFESKAINVMEKYGGKLLMAFEPDNAESTLSNIAEVHCLEFPDIGAFNNYRTDPDLTALSDLRRRAIAKTTIYVSGKNIDYNSQEA